MSYYEREYKRRLLVGQGNTALITLIAIHLIMFVMFFFVETFLQARYQVKAQAFEVYNNNVLSWIVLPADMSRLASRPWTIITHMFMETSTWKLIANMLWLAAFGRILQDLTGNRKIFPVFLYGSLGGAIAFVLTYNFLPSLKDQLPTAYAMGAGAGVIALAVATTMVSPTYRIFPMLAGGFPLWILTAVFAVVDLSGIRIADKATYFSHLSGALVGFLFMYFFRRGYDWGEWMNNFWDWFNNLFNPDKPKKGREIKQELFYKSTTQPFKKTPNVTEQRIDEILDKINQKGYASLNEEEKELLKRASQDGL